MKAIDMLNPIARYSEYQDWEVVLPQEAGIPPGNHRNAEVQLPTGTADLSRGEVRYQDGERAELSGREAALLEYLANHAGRVITRDEILLRVWQLNPHCTITRTIDMHVAKLRDKLRDDARKPTVLLTVRGRGYLFTGTLAGPPRENGRVPCAALA